MLKFANHDVVFQEVPDHVTLAINISNCPNHCLGCHSPYLWNDVGNELNNNILDKLIHKNDGITCVCFMGGDQAPAEVEKLAKHVKNAFPKLKVAWYSGKEEIPPVIDICNFDYVKTGRYDEKCGPLSSPTTNQRMLKILADGRKENITNFFQKKRIISQHRKEH